MDQSCLDHMLKFIFIFWGHNYHIGHMPKKRQIKSPMMGCPVFSHQSSPINTKGHRQILGCHIMHNLIIGPLQKGRVHTDNRPHIISGETSGICHCMLLGNPDINQTGGKLLFKLRHSRSLAHRSRND